MRSEAELRRLVDVYSRQGWYPAKWAHHPPEIKAELRRMGYRPRVKECYQNCQRFLMRTKLDDLWYVEGHAGTVVPVPHCWLLYKDQVVDLTLPPDAVHYEITFVYTRLQVMNHLARTGVFSPVSEAANYYTNPLNVALHAAGALELLQYTPERTTMHLRMLEDGLEEVQIMALFEMFDEEVRKHRKQEKVA
jgi:hypothetical protein